MRALQKNMDAQGELITLTQAAACINSSLETARKIAKAAGAERHIGRSYRVKRSVFLDYIEKENVKA